MPLSRVRMRLTAGYALTFALGLGVLAAGALGYLWRESGRRLDTRLAGVSEGVAKALARELNDAPDSPLSFAVNEVVKEWPPNDDAFGIVDERGALVAGVNHGRALDAAIGEFARARGATRFSFRTAGADYRAVAIPVAVFRAKGREWRFGVVAFGSTEGIESDTVMLGGALAVAAPLIVLLSVVAGYLLARRALHPVHELSAAISAIAPNDLSRRLPAAERGDEFDTLAAEFNSLLARLDEAQQRNRGFVREAAHQIRTPLTLVLGESGYELSATESSPERLRAAMGRIRSAAEQMRRRVDELFLLAEAQAGEPVRTDDEVELDGLVLECTDLMRKRASDLGRSLAIGRADHVVVRANAALLKEALTELLENACRHGAPDMPVTVSTFAAAGRALIEVESAGRPFTLPVKVESTLSQGLGLAIVQWIATSHGGELRVEPRSNHTVVILSLPVSLAPLGSSGARKTV